MQHRTYCNAIIKIRVNSYFRAAQRVMICRDRVLCRLVMVGQLMSVVVLAMITCSRRISDQSSQRVTIFHPCNSLEYRRYYPTGTALY
ncbi:hypothetical protein ASPWEDRAFT_188625 [Aspergillus wentii DTO 134E9]|uniref:Uncharacterized protein n=1 Tax=Aspergillus wentii DTO 134E9 TaxID=1073089 RepID=A0A1L9RYJ7_ASPWE|nr:uncharacterized protein ASPWEDRAFT_188625 [Aspergillus wentii DTO 134E9]OJJ39985.1 hypothetical protein ASPWEDRAFT_188625 [Aspergillus wentii DTO 134E9]